MVWRGEVSFVFVNFFLKGRLNNQEHGTGQVHKNKGVDVIGSIGKARKGGGLNV